MRKIYLHIGCGKTGSSALQVWFNQNAKKFGRAGIYYPTHDQKIENSYEITSGNGVYAYQEVVNGTFPRYLEKIAASGNGDILLSSEIFQLLNAGQIQSFKSTIEAAGFDLVVIAYVRDLYDILTSMHHQFVKRHLFHKDFSQFVHELKSIQQFDVVNLWSSICGDVRVIHYDSVVDNLGAAFLNAVGLKSKSIPPIGKHKVNRSLTRLELNIIRLCNKLYCDKISRPSEGFSAHLSDALIAANPERNEPAFYDPEIKENLLLRFGKMVDEFNSKYFNGENRLSVLRQTDKEGCGVDAGLPEEFTIALKSIFDYADFSGGADCQDSASVENKPLKITDPRIVDVLRSDAIRRESFDLDFSIALMKAAQKLRPTGPVINQKLKEYETLMKDRRDNP